MQFTFIMFSGIQTEIYTIQSSTYHLHSISRTNNDFDLDSLFQHFQRFCYFGEIENLLLITVLYNAKQ